MEGVVGVGRLVATATCTAFGGVVEGSGEQVGQRLLYRRVSFLASLWQELTRGLVASRWDEDSLDVLAAGVDGQGKDLPSKGWMAMRRLGWAGNAAPAEGMYVSDRVRRAAEEYAARTLRLAVHRRALVAAVLATWPADPRRRTGAEWAALQALLPTGVSGVEIRNRTRQVRAYLAGHGKLPAGLCELEESPQVAAQVLLAAMDRQQVTLQRLDETTARLRVKLPLCAAPASGREWAWHVIDLRLPGTVDPDAVLHISTLRPTRAGRIAVDLPHSRPAPATTASGHRVAVGFDWGVNTLLTGTVGRLIGRAATARVVTDGRPLVFDATVVSAKLHRLRTHREHLAAKRDHYRALADRLGFPHRPGPPRPAGHRLPAVCPMCVRSPPPSPPGWSSVRRGMTPRHQHLTVRCQVMEYPHHPGRSLLGSARCGSHAEPVGGAPAPPSGPASTTCTSPKSTPSPRGSDPTMILLVNSVPSGVTARWPGRRPFCRSGRGWGAGCRCSRGLGRRCRG
ncbi:hypothetical protein [Streptomyces sp. HC307]|uniref:hypothetical protein n=1 Tax=Streptomyces flavusporus TaxID=3385496 RepID=UPI003916E46E